MMNRSVKWIVAFFFLPLLISGCAVATRTPSLSSDQSKTIKSIKYDVVIGVEKHFFPAYSNKIYEVLHETKMFADVIYTNEGENYDIVARVDGSGAHNDEIIPLLAIFSLGIIPEFYEGQMGVTFSLQDKDKKKSKVMFNGVTDSGYIIGWFALLASLLPQYEIITSNAQSSRYINWLKYKISTCKECQDLLLE